VQLQSATEWKFQACLKLLKAPANYMRALVVDVLFPTRRVEPETQIIWVSP
jgi:hypothetical protein